MSQQVFWQWFQNCGMIPSWVIYGKLKFLYMVFEFRDYFSLKEDTPKADLWTFEAIFNSFSLQPYALIKISPFAFCYSSKQTHVHFL